MDRNPNTAETSSIKGAGLVSAMQHIRETHGESGLERVLDAVPTPRRSDLLQAPVRSWLPLSALDALLTAYAESSLAGDDVTDRYQALERLGGAVAERDLGSVFRPALAFVHSDRVADMLPRLWDLYFQGVEVEVRRLDVPATVEVRVSGLACRHLVPVETGWLRYAWAYTGQTRIEISERAWTRGEILADPQIFRICWAPDNTP